MAVSATPDRVIRQIVETMRALAGPHPGFRPSPTSSAAKASEERSLW